LDKWYKVIVER